MTVVDWILLGVLAISLLLGAWRGLVYEVLSLVSWTAAFLTAQWLAPSLALHLPLGELAEPLRYAAAFALIFILIAFIGGLLVSLIKKAVNAVGLRPVDRALGMVFGVARASVLLLAVAVVAGLTPLGQSPVWRESVGAPYLNALLVWLKPTLPPTFARYIV